MSNLFRLEQAMDEPSSTNHFVELLLHLFVRCQNYDLTPTYVRAARPRSRKACATQATAPDPATDRRTKKNPEEARVTTLPWIISVLRHQICTMRKSKTYALAVTAVPTSIASKMCSWLRVVIDARDLCTPSPLFVARQRNESRRSTDRTLSTIQ